MTCRAGRFKLYKGAKVAGLPFHFAIPLQFRYFMANAQNGF